MDDTRLWKQAAPDHLIRTIHSEKEMFEIGEQLANYLAAGDVVALIGDLGAGKTRLVKAVAQACGVPEKEVNSPTFTLIHEYAGRLLLRHCDTYRLRHPAEFAELGLDELFAEDGIALVEWADRVENDLPLDHLVVRIQIDAPEARTIELLATGRRSRQILKKIPVETNESG